MRNNIKRYNQYINENKSSTLLNVILDKISTYGLDRLSKDERLYLNQHRNNSIDKGLEEWLLSDSDETYDPYSNKKLLYSEFEYDEDIFNNHKKLIRVISKSIGDEPYSTNADWGGADVWDIESEDGFLGKFIVLGDDNLVVLNRILVNEDEYEDEVLINIKDVRQLYNTLLKIKKGEI